MTILQGTMQDGTVIPVQVDAQGRLVAEGLPGPAGPAGPQGLKGDKGDPGSSGGLIGPTWSAQVTTNTGAGFPVPNAFDGRTDTYSELPNTLDNTIFDVRAWLALPLWGVWKALISREQGDVYISQTSDGGTFTDISRGNISTPYWFTLGQGSLISFSVRRYGAFHPDSIRVHQITFDGRPLIDGLLP